MVPILSSSLHKSSLLGFSAKVQVHEPKSLLKIPILVNGIWSSLHQAYESTSLLFPISVISRTFFPDCPVDKCCSSLKVPACQRKDHAYDTKAGENAKCDLDAGH